MNPFAVCAAVRARRTRAPVPAKVQHVQRHMSFKKLKAKVYAVSMRYAKLERRVAGGRGSTRDTKAISMYKGLAAAWNQVYGLRHGERCQELPGSRPARLRRRHHSR